MIIKFFNNAECIQIVEVDLSHLKRLSFGLGVVKEICFAIELPVEQLPEGERNQHFKELYDQLKSLETTQVTDTYVYFTESQYYHFHTPVKKILYRTHGYCNATNFMLIESLSIRFTEDFKLEVVDNKSICCSNDCPFHSYQYCKFFKESLKQYQERDIICKSCFLEQEQGFFTTERLALYNTMRQELGVDG